MPVRAVLIEWQQLLLASDQIGLGPDLLGRNRGSSSKQSLDGGLVRLRAHSHPMSLKNKVQIMNTQLIKKFIDYE